MRAAVIHGPFSIIYRGSKHKDILAFAVSAFSLSYAPFSKLVYTNASREFHMTSTPKDVPVKDEYEWANYLISMEAGAELPWPIAELKPHLVWEGVLFAATLAFASYVAVDSGVLPKGVDAVAVVLPLSIFIGNFFTLPKRFKTGIHYSLKTILMVGIILLGARLNFADVIKVGGSALVLSAAQVGLMLALAVAMRKPFGIGEKQATLLGIGTAICGGSAIIACAPIIEAEERDIAFAVTTVSFLGLATMFTLPIIGQALNMDPRSFGVWAGLAIHQTPQVVAAGFAYGPDAGQAAILVKLSRVSLLAPLVLALGFFHRKSGLAGGKRRKLGLTDFLPPMVLGFVVMAVVNSLGLLPSVDIKFPRWPVFTVDVSTLIKTLSGYAIVTGMAAVGLETPLRSLRNLGWRPAAAGLVLTLASVLFSFAAVRLFVQIN